MVKQKLMQVMKEREDKKRLKGLIQLDDAYWGGQRYGGKRGRGSQGKIPFVAAVEVSEDGCPIAMKFKVVNAFRSHPIECWAKQSLEPGTCVVSDGLACFKVPDRGSVNPPPLGGWDGKLYGCKTIKVVAIRFGIVSITLFG